MLFSDGQLGIFWSNPLVGSLTTAALLMLCWPLLAQGLQALRPGQPRVKVRPL